MREREEVDEEFLEAMSTIGSNKFLPWVQMCIDALVDEEINYDDEIVDGLEVQDIMIALMIAKWKMKVNGGIR